MKKAMLVLVVLGIASLCFGTVRRVPSQYSTIMNAMNACSEWDTILVAKGTYNENVTFKTNRVQLISESGADSTEIHGNGSVTISSSVSGMDVSTLLYGFKITGGTGGYGGEGGGLRMWKQAITVRKCIFTDNHANEGGGFYLERSDAVIESCLIYGNNAIVSSPPGGTGGGVYTFSDFGDGKPIVRYNTIINNDANGNGNFINGGGAIAFQKTAGTAVGNYIANNTAKYGNGGIAFMSMGGVYEIIVTNNIIKDNDSIAIDMRYLSAANAHINNNNISGHQYGLKFEYRAVGVLDATNNWWGDASGPYHKTLNTGGLGDAVGDTVISSVHSVNFNPWLTDTNIAIEIVKPIEPYTLSTCWPNPFVHQTSVKLESKFWTLVSAVVFDITGREVRCIMNSCPKSAGSYNISWDGKDKYGKQVPPGMYFYRVKVNNTSKTMKVIMIR